jgi:hypothetical protein
MGRAFSMLSGLFGKTAFRLALIALLGLLAYSDTFDSPFQFDDSDYITGNPLLKEPGYFIDAAKADKIKVSRNVELTRKTRRVGFLSFALNYRIHGLDVRGYHIFNLAIHLINSLLVYYLVALTLKTPFLSASHSPAPCPLKGEGYEGNDFTKNIPPPLRGGDKTYIALFAALLFVSHPVQTQAVTYISQRFASLAAFFYLGSIVLYAKWRLKTEHPSTGSGFMASLSDHAPYLISILFAVLAMYTKENAFTLPVSLLLYEAVFFGRPSGKRLISLIPFALTMLIIPLNAFGAGGLEEATRAGSPVARLDYLFTQFRVVVAYLRLLMMPVNQNLDYDYPVYGSIPAPSVFISLLFLLCLLGAGTYLLLRPGRSFGRRLAGFGILWFFLTLSVESSIIPTRDMIFEHRLYLPSAGFFIVSSTAVFLITHRWRGAGAPAVVGAALIILTLSGATYARNRVWGSEIGLWEDVVKKSPRKARGYVNLGEAYMHAGLPDKAIESLMVALNLDPEYDVYYNLGVAYHKKEMLDAAIAHYQEALRIRPDYPEARYNLANAYFSKGQTDSAREELVKALETDPEFEQAVRLLNRIALTNTPPVDTR